MLTLGIDLASQPKNTAACVIRWEGSVIVEDPVVGLSDDDLVRLMEGVDQIGIDVPFGWPSAFAQSLVDYQAHRRWALPHPTKALYLRATDLFVEKTAPRRPLSVSADKIAVPAMRAAHLLSNLDPGFDRSGGGRFVEVYPAASLTAWSFDANRYKGAKGANTRRHLLEAFRDATTDWVELSRTANAACLANDDAFDALIASLTARAWALRQCWPVPEAHAEAAALEGWIALPKPDSLAQLR